MAKNEFEKALEKQQRETKRLAEKQQRVEKQRMENEVKRERANAIVSGQPIVGGMRIMDASAEEILTKILSIYDGNENRFVSGNYENIPIPYQGSLSLEFEKLNMYGMISNSHIWINSAWELTLTPQGIRYFKDKKFAKKKGDDTLQKTTLYKQYDVFISHASKDKSDYVDLLYMSLKKLGINIFYDTEVLSWGDNWKQVILNGTASSEFAIIVISENFFDREWTEKELTEFLEKQNSSGQKIVLPLLHKISLEQLKEKYPQLGEIQVINTQEYSREEISILFAKELIKRYKKV